MSWLFFALLAPAVYACVTFIDKYLVSKVVKDYNAMPIYTALVGLVAGSVIWVFTGFSVLNQTDALIVLTTGVLTALSLIVYFKALSFEETSVVNILFQMFPVITLVLSYIFLKETITSRQFTGFVLILLSVIAISIEGGKKKLALSPAFFLILIYDFLWASAGVIMNYALNISSFWTVLVYESWGVGLGGLIIFLGIKKSRKAFLKNVKTVRKKAISTIFLNESVFLLAKSLTFFAFYLGPAALVSVLETSQTFYAIFFGYILTLIFPSVFNEDMSKMGVIKKIVASMILIIGVSLLT